MEWKWLSLLLYYHYNRHCTSESVCEYVYVCISLSLFFCVFFCLSFFPFCHPFCSRPHPRWRRSSICDCRNGHCDTWLFQRKTGGKMNFLEIWYWWSPWSENFFHLRETIDKRLKISIFKSKVWVTEDEIN